MNVILGVTNLASGAAATVEALVDLGTLLPVLPASLLAQFGIVPVRRQLFEGRDGKRRSLPVGFVRIEIAGHSAATLCAFADDVNPPLLGLRGLQAVGLTPDSAGSALILASDAET